MRRKVLLSSDDWDDKPRKRTVEELLADAKEKPDVELQKVDTAKFVFLWENSSSVEEVALGMLHPDYKGGLHEDEISLARKLAEVIRTVEAIPLKELPDQRPTVKRGKRISNFS